MTRALALAVVVALTACTGADGTTAHDDLRTRLVTPDRLTGEWRPQQVDATQVGGGFCGLEALVASSEPAARAHTALVAGQIQLRQSLARYPDDAGEQLAAIDERLRTCGADDEASELGLGVEPLPPVDEDLVSYRLRVEVASVPLVLDLAAWRQDDVVAITRLTYPDGSLDDPAGTLGEVVETSRQPR